MKRFWLVFSLFLFGFFVTFLINLFLGWLVIYQYTIIPVIHSSIIILGYKFLSKEEIVQNYKILNFIFLTLVLAGIYYILDFSPVGSYLGPFGYGFF